MECSYTDLLNEAKAKLQEANDVVARLTQDKNNIFILMFQGIESNKEMLIAKLENIEKAFIKADADQDAARINKEVLQEKINKFK